MSAIRKQSLPWYARLVRVGRTHLRATALTLLADCTVGIAIETTMCAYASFSLQSIVSSRACDRVLEGLTVRRLFAEQFGGTFDNLKNIWII